MFKYKAEPVGRLVEEFGAGHATPLKILETVVEKGSLDNTWNLKGCPTEYNEDVWGAMADIIREHREEKQRRSPAKTIRPVLISRFDNEAAPSIRTTQPQPFDLRQGGRSSWAGPEHAGGR